MSHPSLESWTVADYERAAEEYLLALPPEHFMEATRQAFQRKITGQSLDLVSLERPEVQTFSELLVQYPLNGHLGQVVPDNMVILSDEEIQHTTSYNLPFEPAPPFWVLEYVSASNKRKDYHDNLLKYERELKVPYYLLFDPETKDLRLYHHNGVAYELVPPNAEGRLAIPELELEVGLLGEWVRFWFRGQLLPLSTELRQMLNEMAIKLQQTKERADEEKRRADEEKRRADEAEKRIDDEKRRADDEKRRADEEKRRADEAEKRIDGEKRRGEEEKRRADEAEKRINEEKRRADEAARQTEEERKRLADLEAILQRVQAQLRQLQPPAPAEEPPAEG